MISENTVFLAGNIGRDPEFGTTNSGTKVANISLAVTRCWTTPAGDYREDTDYFPIECYGLLADDVQKLMQKGSSIHVRGVLKNVSWDGGARHKTVIVAEKVILVKR